MNEGYDTRSDAGRGDALRPPAPGGTRSGRVYLMCTDGGLAGRVFAWAGDAMLLGRDPQCHLAIPDPSASWRHARLERSADGSMRIVDLNSRNGTLVNDVRIEQGPVTHGDRLRLGNTIFTLLCPSSEDVLLSPPPLPPGTPGASSAGPLGTMRAVRSPSGAHAVRPASGIHPPSGLAPLPPMPPSQPVPQGPVSPAPPAGAPSSSQSMPSPVPVPVVAPGASSAAAFPATPGMGGVGGVSRPTLLPTEAIQDGGHTNFDEANERYRLIFQSAVDAILIVDSRLRIKEANRAAGDLLRQHPDRLAGMGLEDFQPRPVGTETPLRDLLAAADAVNIEFGLTLADMTAIHVECRATRVQKKHLLVMRDATVRRRQQEELRATTERLTLLNTLSAGLSRSLELPKIVAVCNRHLEQSLRTPPCTVLRYDPSSDELSVMPGESAVLAPGGFPRAGSGLEECLTARRPVFLAPPTGPALRLAAGCPGLLAVPLAVGGRTLGVLGVPCRQSTGYPPAMVSFLATVGESLATALNNALLYQDIQLRLADLKTRQERIVHQERLRAVGQMASGIAHDLNNSLSGILGFAEVLLAGRQPLPEHVREPISKIHTSAKDAADTVARLREFYRPADPVEFEAADLSAIAEQAVQLTEPRWRGTPQSKGIRIEMRFNRGAAAAALVSAKPQEVREALVNLIFNAVDALPGGGTITVSTGSDAAAAWVSVTDDGIGMSQEVQDRLFQPFFTTKGTSGSGLGLSQCYGIMQRHRGEIRVQSRPGAGSTFTLRFPLRELASSKGEMPSARNPLTGRKVLYVDDEPRVREAVQAMLETFDLRVEVAADPYEALRRIESAEFDFVVTDLGMPEMSGSQLAREIRRRRPGLPVGLLTGWAEQLQLEGNLPAEIAALSGKPPTLRSLSKLLASLASKARGPDSPFGADGGHGGHVGAGTVTPSL
jgi:PAS domain S-box-containing protein